MIRRQAQHTKRHLHVTQRIVLEYVASRDASLHRAALLSDGENLVGRRTIPPLGAAMDETDFFEGISRLRRESATDLGVAAPAADAFKRRQHGIAPQRNHRRGAFSAHLKSRTSVVLAPCGRVHRQTYSGAGCLRKHTRPCGFNAWQAERVRPDCRTDRLTRSASRQVLSRYRSEMTGQLFVTARPHSQDPRR